MLGPVTAQVIHVGVDIAQRDRPGQVQIHVVNRNFIQLGGTWCFAFFDFHIAEEVAQIQVVFIHRFSGVTLNGLMIHQKVPQNRRSSQTVVICIQILPPTQQNFYFVELEIYPLSKNSPQFTTPVLAGQAGRLRRLACLSLASRSLSAMA